MMRELDEAFKTAREIAAAKSEQITNELQAAAEAVGAAQAALGMGLEEAKRLRSQAAELHDKAMKRENEAVRAFTTQMTELTAIIVALKQQLEDGEIVTGAESTPPKGLRAIQ